MNMPPPIAVLGLYNSGSTALAGALHRLGVHMGPPYWYNSDEDAKDNYYEPWDLGCQLRYWWNEPLLRENTDGRIRIACLANWLRMRQAIHPGVVGAKHPLLCLCGEELVTAWGQNTIFLRTWRPLEESIARLKARNWFSPHEDRLQRILWQALEQFCARRLHFTVEYPHWRTEPAVVLREIADYAHLHPTAAQFAAAERFIHRI